MGYVISGKQSWQQPDYSYEYKLPGLRETGNDTLEKYWYNNNKPNISQC